MLDDHCGVAVGVVDKQAGAIPSQRADVKLDVAIAVGIRGQRVIAVLFTRMLGRTWMVEIDNHVLSHVKAFSPTIEVAQGLYADSDLQA